MRSVFLSLLAAVLSACSRGSGTPALPHKPSILLVTIDTLRADHVGCYGHAPSPTPTIDGLAAEGVRFEEARSHVPSPPRPTPPS